MKKLVLLATTALLLAGCAPARPISAESEYLIRGECNGIEVVVNFGILGKRQATCVEASEPMNTK